MTHGEWLKQLLGLSITCHFLFEIHLHIRLQHPEEAQMASQGAMAS